MKNMKTRMISVCMATYNGERWIEEQLKSILSQLGEGDEVVLVDDGSSDSTLDKVERFADSRVHIFRNDNNLGEVQTFQKALAYARGDVLFLCDQDDVWYPGKVSRVMQAFDKHPNVTLVLSDAQIINSAGRVTGATYFGNRGKFIPGVIPNIIKSKFLGCAIAVKSSMRDCFLPFPEQTSAHDTWIGIINEYYGKTHFIPETLIGYRRHDRNTSSEHRQSFKQIVRWRCQLISSFAKRLWQLKRFTFKRPPPLTL